MNLAHPFSSASVAAGWESGVSQAEKPTPAAGAFEFTSPKSAIQPVPEYEMHHMLYMSIGHRAKQLCITIQYNNSHSLLPRSGSGLRMDPGHL